MQLDDLIASGLKIGVGVSGEVSRSFEKIVQARELGHSWSSIAEALGYQGKERRVAECFHRISRKLESGKLKIKNEKSKTEPTRTLRKIGKSIQKPSSAVFNFNDHLIN